MTTTTDRIHCVKCKVSTDNKSSKIVPMSNGGTRIEAICWGCGSKKSRIQSGPKKGAAAAKTQAKPATTNAAPKAKTTPATKKK